LVFENALFLIEIAMMKKNFKLLVLPSVKNMQQVINRFSFPIELTKGTLKNIKIVFKKNKILVTHNDIDLKNFSLVWLSSSWTSRDLAYAVQLYLDEKNVPSTFVEKGTSKLTDHMIFSLNNISTPDTLFVDISILSKSLAQIKSIIGYPLIVKDIRGSRGTNSMKINSQKELLSKMELFPKHRKYILQQYIPNDYDWGIMVANGVVVSGEKSYHQEGEFLNHALHGATEVFIDKSKIPQKIKDIAVKASKKLGLIWSRADIIINKNNGKPYLMEVNRLPGITDKTSEVDGAYKFLASQINLMSK